MGDLRSFENNTAIHGETLQANFLTTAYKLTRGEGALGIDCPIQLTAITLKVTLVSGSKPSNSTDNGFSETGLIWVKNLQSP